MPPAGHLSNTNADAVWPATMLSDILSDDDEAQLPPLPPDWEQQAEAPLESALKGVSTSAPGQARAPGGLSAAFSSAASDMAHLSLMQLPALHSKPPKTAADAALVRHVLPCGTFTPWPVSESPGFEK